MKTTHHAKPCTPANDTSPYFSQDLMTALGELKTRLVARFEQRWPGRSRMIRQAIAEAEELAWRTPFPHLFLPDFAEVRLTEMAMIREPAYARAA